jgi:hypothetical protein
MYLVFNVFYFYTGVGQKDSGVGRAHLICYALAVGATTLIFFVQKAVANLATSPD